MSRTTPLTRRAALRTGASATGLVGLGAGVGTARSDRSGSTDRCYYQVDFVAGPPIGTLGERPNDLYGRQSRLVQYVHADGNKVVERDTWINSLAPEIRECVSADPIAVGADAASVRFRVEEGCERTFSLAVYRLPDGEFSFGERQELVAADSGTFGAGTHELAVEDRSRAVCGRRADGYGRDRRRTDDDGERAGRAGRAGRRLRTARSTARRRGRLLGRWAGRAPAATGRRLRRTERDVRRVRADAPVGGRPGRRRRRPREREAGIPAGGRGTTTTGTARTVRASRARATTRAAWSG